MSDREYPEPGSKEWRQEREQQVPTCTCDYSGPDPSCPQHGMDRGRWVRVPPKTEGMCSYFDCTNKATWTRKHGWMVAPGSPEGDVCETHHCWEPITTSQSDMVTTQAGVRFQPRSRQPPPGKHHRPPDESLCRNCWPGELADVEGPL